MIIDKYCLAWVGTASMLLLGVLGVGIVLSLSYSSYSIAMTDSSNCQLSLHTTTRKE